MAYISVTLEVSKLSGWLKADARYRVEGRACDAGGRGASREAGGPVGWWRHTRGMHVDVARLKAWGPRARAERTSNMRYMVVTLEVSKLSGSLKADASCRVEGRACDAGGERFEPGGGRACGVVAAHKRHARGKGPTQGLGAKGTRAARTRNISNMVVTLEVTKLSGWLNTDAYCRVEGRACDAGRERWEPGGGRAWGAWWRHTRGMHRDGPTQGLRAKGTRGERT